MTHDQAASLLTEFLQGRIMGSPAKEIAAHVRECTDCASVAATFRLLQAGVPHPSTDEVATLTLAPDRLDAAVRQRLERHVATCASCSEEMEITREAAGSVEPASVASRWKWSHALALAASVAALLLAYPALRAIRDLPGLETEVLRLDGEVKEMRRSLAERRSEEEVRRSWSGAVPLIVLSAPSRGEAPVKSVCVKDGQPGILLAVLPPVTGEGRLASDYQFDVHRGDGSSAWTVSMTSVEIKRSVRDAGVVTFLIPPSVLPSGLYTLSLREKGAPSSILDAPFVVAREGEPGSQCQSPAATNAPQ